MMRKNIKWKGRIMIVILFLSLIIFFNFQSSPILTTQAASGTFTEDFTTTTYMDGVETNASGWGTGDIENSKKKPTIVGSISSSLIGVTVDVFVSGDYAYVTNQGEGLKVVNIIDPTAPYINGSYDTNDSARSVYIEGDYAYIADHEGLAPQDLNFLILNITVPTNPTHLGMCTTVFSAGDAARDVVVVGDTAYVANALGGLSVIDVTDPTNPSRIGVEDTSGTSSQLTVSGNYAYVADGTNGLVIIDINNPLNPTIASTYITGISLATNIVIEGNYAYVVDYNNGIVVVNITNPITPSYVGSWSKSGATDAYVDGHYLYVTDFNDGLSLLDITDPTNPIFVHTLTLPGTQEIFVDDVYAYLACQSGGFQIVQIADISPTLAGSCDTPDLARGVFVSGDFAYVADFSSGLQVLNISDPSSPTLAGSYDTPGEAYRVFVSGDYAYVADRASGIQILDISDPSSPSYAGSYDTPDLAYEVFISGDYAYVVDRFSGLLVLDISVPSSPTLAGSYDTPDLAVGVFVSGDYAYVADRDTVQVLDISVPSTPTLAGSYATPGTAHDVFVVGDFAYVADFSSGLQVLNISDPSSPSFASSYNTYGVAYDVFVSGDYLYVADADHFYVFDISDPSSPSFAASYRTPGFARSVFVSGDYAYVADEASGLLVLEVRNNRASLFASPCFAQSNTVFSASSSTITSAILVDTDSTPASTSITYSLSADGGSNWETTTPELEHVFSNTGDQLKWKAELTTSNVLVTPIIYDLSIDYSTILDAPSLDTPTDSYITDDYTPVFTWYGINGESEYLFQLDTTASFTTPLLNITLPSSSTSYASSSPLIEDTYYWRVAGIDTEGDLGEFSNYRTLYIVTDVNTPTINHPSDVSYEQGTTGNIITWTPADSNPYWYNITVNGLLTSYDDPWLGGDIVMNIDGLSLGTHTAICYVYDLEGHMTSDPVEIEVTTTAPPVIDDVADFGYEEGSTGNSITWHPSDANPDYYSITRDGIIIDEGIWVGGDLNIDIDGLSYGSYIFVCFVNDTEGQSASDSVVVTVTDNVMPILTSPSDVIYSEGDTGNNIIWIATDNNPASYIVYREGVQVETNSWTSGSSIVISVDGLAAASYNYTIVVFDEVGNSAKDEVTVAVTPAVPELTQNIFFALLSIMVIFVIINIKRRTYKKN